MGIDSKNPNAKKGDTAKKQRETGRFFDQQQFIDKATKLYRNLSVPIYVVPAWTGEGRYDFEPSQRATKTDSSVETLLKRYGTSSERAAELEKARAEGAAIFLVRVDQLTSGRLPTPWMIVHAMFDSGDTSEATDIVWHSSVLQKCTSTILRLMQEYGTSVGTMTSGEKRPGADKLFISALTMNSARTGQITTQNIEDAVAEIMCQAILTSGGFVYKKTGDAELDKVLSDIQSTVSVARPAFEKAIRGKLINVDVNVRDF